MQSIPDPTFRTSSLASKTKFKERAQSMVEFAMTLPLLLILIFGIIEFGRLIFFYSAVTTAAREAARFGSAASHYQDCDGIRAAALRIGSLAGVQNTSSSVVVQYDSGPSTTLTSNCPVGNTGPDLALGNRVVVTVSTSFRPVVPLINLKPFTITSVAKRTILMNLPVE